MSDPNQSEVEIVESESMCSRAEAIAIIAALDKHRGECVPVDKLMAKIIRLEAIGAPWQRLYFWLKKRGWLDDKTPVVQTERRKP